MVAQQQLLPFILIVEIDPELGIVLYNRLQLVKIELTAA
jgi:hypothetical protein